MKCVLLHIWLDDIDIFEKILNGARHLRFCFKKDVHFVQRKKVKILKWGSNSHQVKGRKRPLVEKFWTEAWWHIGMSSASHWEDPGSNPSKGRYFRLFARLLVLLQNTLLYKYSCPHKRSNIICNVYMCNDDWNIDHRSRDSGNDFFVSQISDGSGTFPFFYFCFFFSFPNVSRNENISGTRKETTFL